LKIGLAAIVTSLCLLSTSVEGALVSGSFKRWQLEFSSSNPALRVRVVREIGSNPTVFSLPLIRSALADSDLNVRLAAAEVVSEQRYAIATDIIPWLESDILEQKLEALRVFVRVPTESAIEPLIRLVFDKIAEVRLLAVAAISMLDEQSVTATLIIAASDSDDRIRRNAVRELAYRNDPQIYDVLVNKLSDVDPYVRADAVAALAARYESFTESLRRQMLFDKSPDVREVAVRSLGRRADDRLKRILISRLDYEESSSVLREIALVLTRYERAETALDTLREWNKLTSERARVAIAEVVRDDTRLAEAVVKTCISDARIGASIDCLVFCGKGGCDDKTVVRLVLANQIPRELALKIIGRAQSIDGLDWAIEQLGFRSENVQNLAFDAIERILTSRPSGLAFDALVQRLEAFGVDDARYSRMIGLIGLTLATKAKELLLGIALAPTYPDSVVIQAVIALRRFDATGCDERLFALLNHPNEQVAITTAAMLFSSRCQSSPRSLFVQSDRTPSRRILRYIVLSALLATTRESGVWSLVERQLSRLTGGDRDALLEGIARNTSPDAKDLFYRIRRNLSVADRRKIASAWDATDEALEPLVSFANDSTVAVRLHAISSIGRLGNARHIPMLLRFLTNPNVEVQSNAISSLGYIAKRRKQPIATYVCSFLESRISTLQKSALSALSVTGERCGNGMIERKLTRVRDTSIRFAATRLIVASQRAEDAPDLLRCLNFESNSAIRRLCSENDVPARDPWKAVSRLVFVVEDGQNVPMTETEFAISEDNGGVIFGFTDRRGATLVTLPNDVDPALHVIPTDANVIDKER
jgi:HEAT repeat protein